MNTDAIVSALADHGIDTYFLVTGGAIVPFVDAVGRSSRARYICFQHEQAAAMAAEGYYRACGRVAVVLVTSGPGVQNLLNGVCGCWYDSIPTLFLSGQVNMRESLDSIESKPRQVGFQEFPVEDTFRPCTKYVKKIRADSEIEEVLSTALSAMFSGRRGPVLVDFPVNFQMTPRSDPMILSIVRDPPPPLPSSLSEVASHLANASRPLLVIGNGCRDIIDQVRSWIETAGIPFVTSWGAIDLLPHDHPLRIGDIGVYGSRVANLAFQNADVLFVLGSRMDTRQTGGSLSLCSRTSVRILVDIDAEELAKLPERGFPVHYPLHASVGDVLSALPAVPHSCSGWKATLSEWSIALSVEPGRVPGDVYSILQSIPLPDSCLIIPDCGGNLVWTLQSLRLTGKQMLFSNYGNSSMGYALPAAIGASLGAGKDVPVLCICGDGGIQMNVQELQTLRMLNLPITVVIINNSGYGIIRQFQDQYFQSRYTATQSSDVFGPEGIDIVRIAKAYGIDATASTTDIHLHNSPFLYDVQINPDQKIYPKLEFGNALENMSPIRPEIESMMLVPYTQPLRAAGWVSK